MNQTVFCFSSQLELEAAFPDGAPDGVPVATTGVGLIDAAIGTTRLLQELAPARLVFLGTCGAHVGCGLEVGDVVYATRIRLGSGDVARGEMRIPSLLPSEVTCDPALGAEIAGPGARAAHVSCTLGVTESDELANSLCAHDGSHVENLEAFSVAHAARGIEVAVVLGVTNRVGAGGGRDWFANYRAVMRRLATVVQSDETRALT